MKNSWVLFICIALFMGAAGCEQGGSGAITTDQTQATGAGSLAANCGGAGQAPCTCAEGLVMDGNVCVAACPEGKVVGDDGACNCVAGLAPAPDGSCKPAGQCADGQVITPNGCADECPAGQEVVGTLTQGLPPNTVTVGFCNCPEGKVYDGTGACVAAAPDKNIGVMPGTVGKLDATRTLSIPKVVKCDAALIYNSATNTCTACPKKSDPLQEDNAVKETDSKSPRFGKCVCTVDYVLDASGDCQAKCPEGQEKDFTNDTCKAVATADSGGAGDGTATASSYKLKDGDVRLQIWTLDYWEAGTDGPFSVKICKKDRNVCQVTGAYLRKENLDHDIRNEKRIYTLQTGDFESPPTWNNEWTADDLVYFSITNHNEEDGWAIGGIEVDAKDESGTWKPIYFNPVVNKVVDRNENMQPVIHFSIYDTAVYLQITTASNEDYAGTNSNVLAVFPRTEDIKGEDRLYMIATQEPELPHWVFPPGDIFEQGVGSERNGFPKELRGMFATANPGKNWLFLDLSWNTTDTKGGKEHNDFQKGKGDGYGNYFFDQDPIGREFTIWKNNDNDNPSWKLWAVNAMIFKPGDPRFFQKDNKDPKVCAMFKSGVIDQWLEGEISNYGPKSITTACSAFDPESAQFNQGTIYPHSFQTRMDKGIILQVGW